MTIRPGSLAILSMKIRASLIDRFQAECDVIDIAQHLCWRSIISMLKLS